MKLKPSIVQVILVALILMLIAANIGLYVFGKQFISENNTAVTELATKVKTTRNEISRMASIEQQYNAIKDVPAIVDELFAPSADKAYQEKLITTLYDYADKSKLTINNINLTTTTKSRSAGSSIAFGINLKSPVNYSSLLTFIKHIEAGLPRMQINNFSISQTSERGGSDDAAVSTIQVEVFVR